MNKQQIIKEIEKLYPLDSKIQDIALIGLKIFESILHKNNIEFNTLIDWRTYSESILSEYLKECKEYSDKSTKELFAFLDKNYNDSLSFDFIDR